MKRLYCVDTSALVDGWSRYYPPRNFASLWKKIDGLISRNELICSDEVFREVSKQDDGLHAWMKARSAMVRPLDDDTQIAVASIMGQFPKLVESTKGRSGADPFVIALAKVTGATVVTGEKASGKPDKPKIPNVCEHYGIKVLNLTGLITAEEWTF